MGRFREKLKVQLERFFDLLMIIAFDSAVFLCAVLALRFGISITSWLFSEETTVVRIAKTMSCISVICGYAFYIIFDLIWYIRNQVREKS